MPPCPRLRSVIGDVINISPLRGHGYIAPTGLWIYRPYGAIIISPLRGCGMFRPRWGRKHPPKAQQRQKSRPQRGHGYSDPSGVTDVPTPEGSHICRQNGPMPPPTTPAGSHERSLNWIISVDDNRDQCPVRYARHLSSTWCISSGRDFSKRIRSPVSG